MVRLPKWPRPSARGRHGEPLSLFEVRRGDGTDRALSPGETGERTLGLRLNGNTAGCSLRFCLVADGNSSRLSPTFEAIEDYAKAVGSEVVSVRLNRGFAHDLEAMLARVGLPRGWYISATPTIPLLAYSPRRSGRFIVNTCRPPLES